MTRPFLLRRWPWLLLLAAAAAWPKCDLKALPVPVTMVGLRPVVTVGINGTDVPLLLDSGAHYSALTDAAAAQLQLKTGPLPWGMRSEGVTGRIEFRRTRADRLNFRGVELKDVEFLVGGNEPGGGTLGLLGRNLLNWLDNEYDLQNGMLRLVKPEGDCKNASMAYWAGQAPYSEVPMITPSWREVSPPIAAVAQINGRKLEVLFDTGATSLLSLRAARRLGLVDDVKTLEPAGTVRGAGEGEVESWLVPVQSFELGQERIANSRLRVADIRGDHDMLIGIDFFLSHRVYVSWAQQRIYFTYQGGPVFDLTRRDVASDIVSPEGDAPADAAGLLRRAAAFLSRGAHDRALADLDRALELEPASAAALRQRARAQLGLKQPALARRDLDAALRLEPADDVARLDRARLAWAGGEAEQALDDLAQLDRQLPPQAESRRPMGDLYLAMQRPALAVGQYTHWLAARPRDVRRFEILNSRCWARALANIELDAALDDCNLAVDGAPKDANFVDSRGLVNLRLGRLRDALRDYDTALRLEPGKPWSLYGRAIVRLRDGQRDAGLADLAAARAAQPSIDADAARHGLAAPAP